MKNRLFLRIANYLCAVLMIAVLLLQFTPFWNCSDCRSHKGEDKMVSIAEYLWFPEHHKPITNDMTDLYKSLYGEDIVDEYGKPFKFDVDHISAELVIAFVCGILAPVVGILFAKKALPLVIPMCGSVATLMIFLLSPVLQAGQNWIFSVIAAGVCAAVAGAGLAVGFVAWVKVRGRYFGFPRRVPIAE